MSDDPRVSLRDAVIFDPRDWSENWCDAWIYGVVVGWKGGAMAEVCKRHGWDEEQVRRLEQFHLRFLGLREE